MRQDESGLQYPVISGYKIVMAGVIFRAEGGAQSNVTVTWDQVEDLFKAWGGEGDVVLTVGPNGPEQSRFLIPHQIFVSLKEDIRKLVEHFDL